MTLIRLASWNVNSIRAREERLLAWLARRQPDVVCLQETKVTEEHFPFEALERAGYTSAVQGQKTYNGVAVLSRGELANVQVGLQDGVDDPEARVVSAEVAGVRVISVYVPNGQVVGSEKYAYKLDWLVRLRDYLARTAEPGQALAVCGDFNVAPHDRDVADLELFRDSVLCHADARAAFAGLLDWGLVDSFRELHPEEIKYSWWDYRLLAFPRNRGLRIDHVLATRALRAGLREAEIDRDERKGKKPSDHAPMLAAFEV